METEYNRILELYRNTDTNSSEGAYAAGSYALMMRDVIKPFLDYCNAIDTDLLNYEHSASVSEVIQNFTDLMTTAENEAVRFNNLGKELEVQTPPAPVIDPALLRRWSVYAGEDSEYIAFFRAGGSVTFYEDGRIYTEDWFSGGEWGTWGVDDYADIWVTDQNGVTFYFSLSQGRVGPYDVYYIENADGGGRGEFTLVAYEDYWGFIFVV